MCDMDKQKWECFVQPAQNYLARRVRHRNKVFAVVEPEEQSFGAFENVSANVWTILINTYIHKNKANGKKHRYSEATPILYSSNTFDFRSLAVFTQFPTTILPQRFKNIRSLQIRFSFLELDHITLEEYWGQNLDLFLKMKGLRQLVLTIEDVLFDREKVDYILKELERARTSGKLMVRIRWYDYQERVEKEIVKDIWTYLWLRNSAQVHLKLNSQYEGRDNSSKLVRRGFPELLQSLLLNPAICTSYEISTAQCMRSRVVETKRVSYVI